MSARLTRGGGGHTSPSPSFHSEVCGSPGSRSFSPFSPWVPLHDSLMPRLLLDHYPNPSPQRGMCRPQRRRVLASESSVFLKPSPQGRGALCNAAGVCVVEERDDARRKKKVPGTSVASAVLKQFINNHFTNWIHAFFPNISASNAS